MFSRECEYALQAVVYIAGKPKKTYVSIREISRALKIPYHFLGKILQRLVAKKIVHSEKGPKGGFALATPPKEITLLSIVEAVDGLDMFSSCILGLPHCGADAPCPIHHVWGDARQKLYNTLQKKTITELSGESAKLIKNVQRA